MKKLILSILLILLCCSPYIIWILEKETPINVVILDKTVPVDNYREHKSLMWLLNNLKYTNSNTKDYFNYSQDYYGFFPLGDKKYETKALPSDLKNPDLIYIADTYGVYTEDFYEGNPRGNRSELMYGGLQMPEVMSIEKALTNKNILVAEFNTLASPTPSNAREKLEQILGVKWTGWIGRYFADLSGDNPEVPLWMIRNYEKQYSEKWTFSGPGVAFVSKDDKVVVLEVGKELGTQPNRIMFTPKAISEYKVENAIAYNYWFDIIETVNDSQVLAQYQLDLTKEGERFLQANGIPKKFPAVVKRFSKYRTYYFAGDYADNDIVPETWRGIIWRPTLGLSGVDPQNAFYWKVYFPMMKKIMTEIEISK